jgi:hypothetical protein
MAAWLALAWGWALLALLLADAAVTALAVIPWLRSRKVAPVSSSSY